MFGTGAFDTGDARAQYSRALKAPQMLEAAQVTLRQTAERRLVAELELAKLYRDLERITGWNLATWWPRIIGRIRERQGALTDAIVRQDTEVKRAAAEHEAALRDAQGAQALADGLPAARAAAVSAMTGQGATDARQALDEAEKLHHALVVAGRVQYLVASAKGNLTEARRWSFHDRYMGGGVASSAMKQEYIYSANETAAQITSELALLRTELQELSFPTGYFSVQTNDIVASSDIYFDNVISDLAMARRINDSDDRLSRLDIGLTEISAKLGERHKAAIGRIDVLLAAELSSTL